MKSLYTENELMSLGMIYYYSPGIIIVGNIYNASWTIFAAEGEYWRKAGEIGQLGADESLYQWESRCEVEYARAESDRGEIIAVTYVNIRWAYARNVLSKLNIPVYRKVIEMEPTKYYLRGVTQNKEIQLSVEEVVALDWIKY